MIMKASRVKRIFKSDEGWASIPNLMIGDVFLQRGFWKEVVQSVHFVYYKSTIIGLEHLLAIPIWYNTQIIEGKIQSQLDKGV